MVSIAGAKVYRSPDFKDFWSEYYGSVEGMQRAVEILEAAPEIHLPTMEYGRYQPILVPLANWKKYGSEFWAKELGYARLELTNQRNDQPLSNDDPVVPLTRCALLDASIRKCFNSKPPIPFDVTVLAHPKGTPPEADVHIVDLRWDYGNGDNKPPTRLHYTMTCPYRPDPEGGEATK